MPERAPLLWVICIRELYVSVICIVDVNDSPVASVNHKALQLLLFLCKHSLVDADCSCSTYLLFSDWISCLTVAWHVIASIDQVFLHPNAVGRRRRGTRSTWPDRINFRRLTEWPLSCVDPLMVLSVLNSLEELALASAGSFVLFFFFDCTVDRSFHFNFLTSRPIPLCAILQCQLSISCPQVRYWCTPRIRNVGLLLSLLLPIVLEHVVGHWVPETLCRCFGRHPFAPASSQFLNMASKTVETRIEWRRRRLRCPSYIKSVCLFMLGVIHTDYWHPF